MRYCVYSENLVVHLGLMGIKLEEEEASWQWAWSPCLVNTLASCGVAYLRYVRLCILEVSFVGEARKQS